MSTNPESTQKESNPTVLVLTEQSEKEHPVPCGYNPDVVVQLKFRVSNTMYEDIKQEKALGGFSDAAEYVKQAIREKLYNDKLGRATLKIAEKTGEP